MNIPMVKIKMLSLRYIVRVPLSERVAHARYLDKKQ